jgi:hypothetical protein
MDEQNENFDQLRKLMALKKHEVPPPGYFNRFSGEVIARIREERQGGQGFVSQLDSEAPWLMRLWQALEAKPLFAGAFGAAICSLVLAGIYFTNKPAETPSFANQGQRNSPFMAGVADPASPASALNTPLLLAATNLNDSTPQNLFDLVQPLQVAPVSATPKP